MNFIFIVALFFVRVYFTSGVGKLRPADQLRPSKCKTAAREHVFYINGMRPAKEKAAAREHVNVALEHVNLSR